jgi:hypothetical protein
LSFWEEVSDGERASEPRLRSERVFDTLSYYACTDTAVDANSIVFFELARLIFL